MEGTISRFNRAVCGYFTLRTTNLSTIKVALHSGVGFGSLVPEPDIPWVSRRTAKQAADPLTGICHFE